MSPSSLSAALNPVQDRLELLVLTEARGPVNLTLTDAGLTVTSRRKGTFQNFATSLKIKNAASTSTKTIPYVQVLSAQSSRSSPDAPVARISIAALFSRTQKKPTPIWSLNGDVHEVAHDREQRAGGDCRVQWWCEELERRAYAGVKQHRRLRVIINPHGGKGAAKRIYHEVIAPVFKAAGCKVTVDYTGPPGSATDAVLLGKGHDYASYDALVTVSGDGIVHQLLNGLASRPDALLALRSTPIVPLPAGSGNALSVNIIGPHRSHDCAWAALGAVKGKPLAMDLMSVVQGEKRSYAFLSHAFGLMADLDLGTEHMRWMGDARFTVGYVQGAVAGRTYPVELSLNVVESSKAAIASTYNKSLASPPLPLDNTELPPADQGMPALEFPSTSAPLPSQATERIHTTLPTELEPGWHTIKADVMFVYGGKLPFIAKDMKLFPPSGSDGLVDVVIVPPMGRVDALTAMDGGAEGKIFNLPTVRYYKCAGFRLTPGKSSPSSDAPTPKNGAKTTGYISIDGESFPYAPFQVEVHSGLARVLSLNNKFWGEEMQ